MAKTVSALILESGASGGDLVYIRWALGISVPGARLTTAPGPARLEGSGGWNERAVDRDRAPRSTNHLRMW